MANNGDPVQPQRDQPGSFVPNKIIPLVMVLASSGLLAWNHVEVIQNGQASLWILFLAPLFFFLGIGGLIDPRIAWAIGPRAEHFPLRIKVIGGLLALAGLALSAYLALGVYHFQDAGRKIPPGMIAGLGRCAMSNGLGVLMR